MSVELTRTLTMRLAPHDHAALKALARAHMRTPSQEARLALLQYLRADGKERAPAEPARQEAVKYG